MAFTTGSASSHHDLLDKLRIYLVAQGWTELTWSGVAATINDTQQLRMRGPGAGAGREVFLNFESLGVSGSSLYWWTCRGALAYDADITTWGAQLGEQPYPSLCNFWNGGAIPYWFYVNDRRVIVVAKCNTTYVSFYGGFFLPFGTPPQYPSPLAVLGNDYAAQIYTVSRTERRMFVEPGYGSSTQATGWVRGPTGVWLQGSNHQSGVANDGPLNIGYLNTRFLIWPYNCGGVDGGSAGITLWQSANNNGGIGGVTENLVPTFQNERPIIPTMILTPQMPPVGSLDGAFAIFGSALSSEQIITIGGRSFIVFNSLTRVSGNDFFAVERI